MLMEESSHLSLGEFAGEVTRRPFNVAFNHRRIQEANAVVYWIKLSRISIFQTRASDGAVLAVYFLQGRVPVHFRPYDLLRILDKCLYYRLSEPPGNVT